MEVLYPRCCGLDVHKRFVVAEGATSDWIVSHKTGEFLKQAEVPQAQRPVP